MLLKLKIWLDYDATLLHKRITFAENMSIEIFASKFVVVMGHL